MSRMTLHLRARALALAAAFAIASCQSAQPSSTTPAGGTSAPPTIAATTLPSPTAAPINVVPLFTEAMKGLSSGVVQLDGSATVGPIKVNIAGTTTFDGPDNQGNLTTTVAGVATVVKTVMVAGKAYTKTGDGPWLPAPAPTGGDLTKSLKTSAAGSFTDQGTDTRSGLTVHKLTAASGSAFDPSVFLSSATGVSNVAGTTIFYCADDGTPVGATIQLTWKQAAGAQTLDASMTFDINFSSLGSAETIRVPESVWQRFTSGRYGYTLAYPPDYNYSKDKTYDSFIGPDSTVFSASRSRTQGYTLNVLAKGELSSIKSTFKTKSVSNSGITVGGLQGRLLTASGTNANFGGAVVVNEAIAVKGAYAYYLVWFSKPGNEAADLATFKQAIMTFAITS